CANPIHGTNVTTRTGARQGALVCSFLRNFPAPGGVLARKYHPDYGGPHHTLAGSRHGTRQRRFRKLAEGTHGALRAAAHRVRPVGVRGEPTSGRRRPGAPAHDPPREDEAPRPAATDVS